MDYSDSWKLFGLITTTITTIIGALFGVHLKHSQKQLDQRKLEFDQKFNPMKESLDRCENHITDLEERIAALDGALKSCTDDREKCRQEHTDTMIRLVKMENKAELLEIRNKALEEKVESLQAQLTTLAKG